MRRVRLTETILLENGESVERPRTDVWPLRLSSGYVFDRKGIATARLGDRYKSTGLRFVAANRREAVRRAELWIGELQQQRSGELPAPSATLSVLEAYVLYERDQLPLDGTLTAKRRRSQAELALSVFVGERTQTELTDASARELTTAGMGRLRASHPGTIIKRLQAWGRFLRYCRAAGWIGVDPVSLIRKPQLPKTGGHVYSADELDRLYEWAGKTDPRLELFWRFLAVTGARLDEALSLQWGSVFDGYLDFPRTKGSIPRPFPFGPFVEVVEILDAVKGLPMGSGAHYLRRPAAHLVFPFRAKEVTALLVAALTELEIPISPRPNHTFRSTAINQWRAMGISAEVRARLAGHSVSVAMEHYDAGATAEELEKLIR